MSTNWRRWGAVAVAILLQAGCDFQTSGDAQVTLQIPKRKATLAKSAETSGPEWYRVAVRGPGMEVMEASGEVGTAIRMEVPPGDARVFSAELFSDAALASKTYAGQAAPVKLEAGKPAVVVIEVRKIADNKPPTLTGAKIKEGTYFTDSVLEVVPEGFSDPDGDTPIYKYEWLVNGTVVAGQTGAKLSGDSFLRGDKVACRVTPGDGIAEGAPVLSDEVSIVNAPPVVLSAAWQNTLRTEVNARVEPVYYDADGDLVTAEITWKVNGDPAQVEQGMDYLPSSWYYRGDKVEAVIAPHDGTQAGTPVVLTAIVANTPPVMPEIHLTYGPGFPVQGEGGQGGQGPQIGGETGLVIYPAGEAEPYDADYDELTFEFIWYRNGVEYARNVTGSLAVEPAWDEEWHVVAMAHDGFDHSLPVSSNVYVGLRSVLAADLGMRAGCAITDNNNLTCWGTGYLGDGPYSEYGLVRNIPEFAGAASSVSVGANHICAITLSGELKCWGQANGAGQQGVGDTTPRTTPTTLALPSGETGWVQVAAGEEHTCGLTNKGNVYCWGRGQRLGLLDALDRNAPTLPVYFASPTRKVVAISAGNEHTCAVTDDPSAPVFCWGRNNYGETGEDPQYVTNNGTPAVVMGFPLPATFTLVAAGADHSCAATNEFMYCWGRNDYGQLGNGENGSSHTPTMVTGLTGQFESVSAGMESTCAIVSSEVFCWGRNRNGTLGDGTTYNANSPVQTWTPPLGGLPIAVTQGGWAGCYVADDGGILCWGYNQYGLLGNGQGLAFHEPAQVPSQVMMPTSIDAGDEHVCAIASSDVWCWGVGGYGQFGLISQPTWEYFEPVMSGIPVTDGSEVAVTVSTGSRHTCAIRQNGQVVCMGYNLHGQVGSGVSGGQVDTATPVVGLSEGAIALSLGGGFSCAITPSGAAKCWGDNDFGQLGIGNTESSPVPQATTVAGEHTFVQLSAGNSHACGIDIAGALYCWGRNDLGQLGDGSFEQSDTPVLVWESGTLHVSAGDDFTCAVDSQNTAYCWGSNAWGKLGIGNDVSSVEFPEQVAGFHQVAKVAAGAYHACMLTVSGEVLCWGQNTEYQLGTKTEGLSNVPDTPVEMWGLVTDIAVGADFSCAVDEFGYVQCWGNNALGQTANGEHRSPSGVPGLHAGGEQQQGG